MSANQEGSAPTRWKLRLSPALGGVVLGSVLSWAGVLINNSLDRQYSDEIRYHEQRVEVYSSFLRQCTDEFLRLLAGKPLVGADYMAMHFEFERLRLLTNSEEVLTAAAALHECVTDILNGKVGKEDAARQAALDDYGLRGEACRIAMRRELGMRTLSPLPPYEVQGKED